MQKDKPVRLVCIVELCHGCPPWNKVYSDYSGTYFFCQQILDCKIIRKWSIMEVFANELWRLV